MAEQFAPELATFSPADTALDAGEVQIRRFMVWKRFIRHRLALASLALLLLFALVGLLATVIAPYDPFAQVFDPTLAPSAHHLLGTDELGRDEVSRVMLGARISLGVSSGATIVALIIGLIVGCLSGYFGGWLDIVLMRFVDLVLAFPLLFLVLIVAVTVGVNIFSMMLLIGAFSWLYLARLVRAEVLQIKELEYIQAAHAIGLGTGRIIIRHVLPNAVGPIIVSSTFILAGAMYFEAVLDYLGFGLSPDIPSWGNLLTGAQESFYDAPMLAIAPGILLTVAILAVNFVGDGLRDAFDPRHSRNV